MAKTEKYSPEIKMKSAEEYQAGKGIYTIDIFTKRNLAFAKEIKQLRESEEDLLK